MLSSTPPIYRSFMPLYAAPFWTSELIAERKYTMAHRAIEEMTKASEVWNEAKGDRTILVRPDVVLSVESSGFQIDDITAALRIGIVLRELGLLRRAEAMFERILLGHPQCEGAQYELSLSLLQSDRHADALFHARKAAESRPDILRFSLNYARALAGAGDLKQAEIALEHCVPRSLGEAAQIAEMHQFSRYLKQFPRAALEAAIRDTAGTVNYRTESAIDELIFNALHESLPFALVRLGDGEGAWMSLGSGDEADYSDLYRRNRVSFLYDWFGSDELIRSDDFFAFSKKLTDVLQGADVVGIPDAARISHEYRILSPRGVPSSVNILRWVEVSRTNFLGLPPYYTSNNVHMHLASRDFFTRLWKTGKAFGIITSYRSLPEMLRSQAGINVRYEFLIPGDSRNFWEGNNNRPLVQFPNISDNISAQLRSLDLSNTVFLVAAGFVGKQYLDIIKRGGGVALDIGSVANKWANKGSVI
jgi:tetratricopeptide (TPR) repeat protein